MSSSEQQELRRPRGPEYGGSMSLARQNNGDPSDPQRPDVYAHRSAFPGPEGLGEAYAPVATRSEEMTGVLESALIPRALAEFDIPPLSLSDIGTASPVSSSEDSDVELSGDDLFDVGIYDTRDTVLPAPVYCGGWDAIPDRPSSIDWGLCSLVLKGSPPAALAPATVSMPSPKSPPRALCGAHKTLRDIQVEKGKFIDAFDMIPDKTGHSNIMSPMMVWEPLVQSGSAARMVAYFVHPDRRMELDPNAPWTAQDTLAMRVFTSPGHTIAPLDVASWGHQPQVFERDRSRMARLDHDIGLLEEHINHSDAGFDLLVTRYYQAVADGVMARTAVSADLKRAGAWACFDANGRGIPIAEWHSRYRALHALRFQWFRTQLRRAPVLAAWLNSAVAERARLTQNMMSDDVDVTHREDGSLWWMPLMAIVGVAAYSLAEKRPYSMYCYLAARVNTL
ncbi:hypothetical protein HOO65_030808 [Ceratocystis lukuohia]|uniref:Uncharacterized protein n=1 Tax=Ceratocystis lukuohia TaxID=2019550 RepID=A0ABR4MLY9_9PEZI